MATIISINASINPELKSSQVKSSQVKASLDLTDLNRRARRGSAAPAAAGGAARHDTRLTRLDSGTARTINGGRCWLRTHTPPAPSTPRAYHNIPALAVNGKERQGSPCQLGHVRENQNDFERGNDLTSNN